MKHAPFNSQFYALQVHTKHNTYSSSFLCRKLTPPHVLCLEGLERITARTLYKRDVRTSGVCSRYFHCIALPPEMTFSNSVTSSFRFMVVFARIPLSLTTGSSIFLAMSSLWAGSTPRLSSNCSQVALAQLERPSSLPLYVSQPVFAPGPRKITSSC